MESILSDYINRCAEDLSRIAKSQELESSFALDAVVRAYDAYDLLLSIKDDPSIIGTEFLQDGTIENFIMEYSSFPKDVSKCLDITAIREELQRRLQLAENELSAAQTKADEAVALHELAKQTYEIWTSKGFIARYIALRKLRKKAGFPLEKDRIGNYVARTFDLMNQARADFAKAQQLRFKADVSYKIDINIYQKIDSILRAIS